MVATIKVPTLVDAPISQIYFVMKLYMFRTVHLPIISRLFTVHLAMVYVILVCRQLSSRTRKELPAVRHVYTALPLTDSLFSTSQAAVQKLQPGGTR